MIGRIKKQIRSVLAYILFCVAIFVSCNQNKQQNVKPTYRWDCSGDINKEEIDLQSIFKNPYIIGLEETSNSRIGVINKIVLDDSLLFVLDADMSKQIVIYNNEGKYIKSIRKIGRAESEYISLNDFSINQKDKQIYLLCDKRKILVYDFEGNFIKIMKPKFSAINIEYSDGRFYFVSEDKNTGSLIVADKNLNITHSHFPNKDNKLFHRLIHPLQKNNDGTVTYMRYLDNNIYRLDRDGNMDILYSIDFGNKSMERDEMSATNEDVSKETQREKRGRIKYFVDGEKYAFIVFFEQGQPCLSLYDKETKESKSYKITSVKDSNTNDMVMPIEYYTGNGFIEVFSRDLISEKKINNKNIVSGNNPLIYYLK